LKRREIQNGPVGCRHCLVPNLTTNRPEKLEQTIRVLQVQWNLNDAVLGGGTVLKADRLGFCLNENKCFSIFYVHQGELFFDVAVGPGQSKILESDLPLGELGSDNMLCLGQKLEPVNRDSKLDFGAGLEADFDPLGGRH
jgi:hypothetical protein